MPSLRKELSDLQLADEHIASAQSHLEHQCVVIAELKAGGHGDAASYALQVIQTMRGALQQYQEHRRQIDQMVHDIQAGKLDNTDDDL